MSTLKHTGEFVFGSDCEIEVSKTDEFGKPVIKKKSFNSGKHYWIDTVTHKPTGYSDIKFYDGFSIVNVNIDEIGNVIGTPNIVGELPQQPAPASEDSSDTDETTETEKPKSKWF